MSIFYVSASLTNPADRQRFAEVSGLLVDTGSECTWVDGSLLETLGVPREPRPKRFVMADGRTATRDVGYAIVRVGTAVTIDEVVFAQAGELHLLGARTLEGLRLRVDPIRKVLVPAGPAPAAAVPDAAATPDATSEAAIAGLR